MAPGKGDCKRCLCNPSGTLEFGGGELNCDQMTGQCKCKPHVIGTNCNECEPGYYDIDSGQVSELKLELSSHPPIYMALYVSASGITVDQFCRAVSHAAVILLVR